MNPMVKKAKALSQKGDYSGAFELLQAADAQGDPTASYALGTWYLHGTHVKRNLKKGFDFLSKASRHNIKEALFDLGVCYEKGQGTSKNSSKAYNAYLSAAGLGDKQAMYEVVRCLYYGIGVQENQEIAKLIAGSIFKHSKNKIPQQLQTSRLLRHNSRKAMVA